MPGDVLSTADVAIRIAWLRRKHWRRAESRLRSPRGFALPLRSVPTVLSEPRTWACGARSGPVTDP